MWKQGWALTAAIGLSLGAVAFANEEDKKETGSQKDEITYPEDQKDEQKGQDVRHEGEEAMKPDLQSGQDSIELSSLKGEKAMELQRKLQQEGHYHGAIDGIVGPLTIKAVEDFQKEEGIEASGKLDSKTASALGLSLSDMQPVSGEESKELEKPAESSEVDVQSGQAPVMTKEEITAAQDKLGTLGFYTGTSSGILDEETMNAVRKFQRSKGIAETGILDEQTLSALGVEKATGIQPQSGTEEPVVEEPAAEKPATEEPATEEPAAEESVDKEDTSGTIEEDTSVETEPQAGTDITTLDKDTIKKVEQALLIRRLDVKMNGVLDKNERQSLKRFQKENGLAATGKPDAPTLAKLGITVEGGTTEQPVTEPTAPPVETTPDTVPPVPEGEATPEPK